MRSASTLSSALAALVALPALAGEPFPTGLASIAIDDGWATQYELARPLLQQYGYRATYYIFTDAIQGWVGYMTVDQVRQLSLEGNEIAAHTTTHPDLTTLTDDQLRAQLADSQAFLMDALGLPDVPDFASPYGSYDDRVLAAIRLFYRSHRTVVPARNWRDADPFLISGYDVYNGVTFDQVRGWIDQAQAERSWIVLLFHEFTTGAPTRSTQVGTSTFEAILDYLRLRGVPVVTMREALEQLVPAPPPPPPPPAGARSVYADALGAGFEDWSWAVHDLAETAVVHSGARAISFEPDAWGGLFFHSASIEAADYGGVELWVHGGSAGGQAVWLSVWQGNRQLGQVLLSDVLGHPIAAGTWDRVGVPFARLGFTSGTFDSIYLQDASGRDQPVLYLDDVVLTAP